MTPIRTVRSRGLALMAGAMPRPAVRPAHRIWLLSATLAGTAALCWVLFGPPSAVRGASAIPWPLIALGMYLAEIKVVNVHFRRETHSFSLSEIPAVIGLFTLSPTDYLLAATIGPALAFVYPARQPLVKAAFNTADYALCATVSVVVFYAVLPDGASAMVGMGAWIAAFAATLSSTVISAVAIASVITLSGGAPQFQKIPEMLHFGGLVALANTSIGLLGITVVTADPAGAWLLAVPVAAVFAAYRAYVSEREKKERLELLYHSSRILQHSPALDSALVALLDHAREMFRSERADCLLLPVEEGEAPLLTRSSVDDEPIVMRPAMEVAPDSLRQRLMRQADAFIYAPERPDAAVRQAMVAPLAGEQGAIGYLIVANRLGEASTYEDDDLRLLETLAGQVAVALQNGQLEQSLDELSRLKDELRYQAYHDSLTRLGNRALLTEAVERRLAAPSPERMTAVLFLDLDDFKIVNDTLGHAAGDELLAAVADRITGCVREDDVAARLGGDEFAILVQDLPDLESSFALATRLRDELSAPIQVRGHELAIDVSIGIAAATSPTVRADELLRNADVAMYTAKSAGKGRVAVFDPTVHAAIVDRHALATDLARGVVRRQFELHYQPLVRLDDGGIVGFEALLRWNHPERGLVSPDGFIQIAEENGSIMSIGRWVLIEACRQAAAWASRPSAPSELVMTVNVSPRQLQAADFIAVVNDALAQSGLPPERLVIEVTETAMFQDALATSAKLEELRRQGVRVALDDFGTGYASLSHLRRFPVDILKIARDFVVDGAASQEDWAFAAAIVALARTLGLHVVAEGIEHPQQVDRLRALGCEMGQGYHLGRPATVADIEAVLANGTSVRVAAAARYG